MILNARWRTSPKGVASATVVINIEQQQASNLGRFLLAVAPAP